MHSHARDGEHSRKWSRAFAYMVATICVHGRHQETKKSKRNYDIYKSTDDTDETDIMLAALAWPFGGHKRSVCNNPCNLLNLLTIKVISRQ